MGGVRWGLDAREAPLVTRLHALGMRHARAATVRRPSSYLVHAPVPTSLDRDSGRHDGLDGSTAPVEPTGTNHLSARGGYVHPLTADYWRLIRALASVPAEVVVPAYPLASDATVDDVLPQLLSLEAQTGSTMVGRVPHTFRSADRPAGW